MTDSSIVLTCADHRLRDSDLQRYLLVMAAAGCLATGLARDACKRECHSGQREPAEVDADIGLATGLPQSRRGGA
ncbi:hypothetical protein BDD41_1820 [Paracoccus versutus]|uniref:Uncharacterized protein n=1 Tax=Paracoccus versutus TaxID=34007 RepID=A0A3D9XSF5_PARVE|nr:hypothetical protein BDD41_1820 [Paracoccus versutus]